jgi:GNAT superfamily N-acetyltransferase
MNRIIRVATTADIPAILKAAEFFVSESSYGMEFDAQNATEYLELILNHDDAVVFISDDARAILIATIATDWCKKPVCYVEKLYISPEHRGTGVSRVLVSALLNFAKLRECSHVFCTATAGMGDRVSKLFENLFAKSGFTACGQVIVKEM